MTVAVVVKVWDGIVLATDSASSLNFGSGVAQVYNSGDKIFQLHRDLPIGAMTWGLGNVGSASIASLAKDVRHRLMGASKSAPDWGLDRDSYTVRQVVDRVVEHFFPLYEGAMAGFAGPDDYPVLGLLVAGYSANEHEAEAWLLEFADPSQPPEPKPAAAQGDYGWVAYAQHEATERLWHGFDRRILFALQAHLSPEEYAKVEGIIEATNVSESPAVPSMPLADAIKLAEFMVDVTSGYTHYRLGPDTVGGPTEVASMSRHEGFRWIKRKHYYDAKLNPRETGHAS